MVLNVGEKSKFAERGVTVNLTFWIKNGALSFYSLKKVPQAVHKNGTDGWLSVLGMKLKTYKILNYVNMFVSNSNDAADDSCNLP